MTEHPTLSEFATNETTDSRPDSQPSTDETVTMTADERVATYLIEDQMAELTDAIREAVQNGIDSPGSSRVLVSVSPERSLILDDGAGVDLESTEGRRNLSVLGAGSKQRADDETIGEWGISASVAIQLDFVEREATPHELMRLSIQRYLDYLSLSDTISFLERFGVERPQLTIHNWVQKADLQPTAGNQPDHIALDGIVIQLTDQRYWLYAAVDPETNEFLHIKLYSTRTTEFTEMLLRELREKHDIKDAMFLVDSPSWFKATLHQLGLRFRYEKHGNQNAIERIFQEIKRRTFQFGYCFRNAEPATAETWLQSYAYCWNQLI